MELDGQLLVDGAALTGCNKAGITATEVFIGKFAQTRESSVRRLWRRSRSESKLLKEMIRYDGVYTNDQGNDVVVCVNGMEKGEKWDGMCEKRQPAHHCAVMTQTAPRSSSSLRRRLRCGSAAQIMTLCGKVASHTRSLQN